MMAAGLPGTAKEHAQSVTNMAFDMREVIDKKDAAKEVNFEAGLEVCTCVDDIFVYPVYIIYVQWIVAYLELHHCKALTCTFSKLHSYF